MTPRRTDASAEGLAVLLRRILGDNVGSAERTAEGVSSEVYRIERGAQTLYLRLAEDPELDLAPEVEAHERLRALGVRVAEIVHYEPFAEELGRSIALTSEIEGVSLIGCTDEQLSRRVARDAGRDVAAINQLEVDGWGWLRRDGRPGLRGAYETRTSWVEGVIDPAARDHIATALGSDAMSRLDRLIEEESRRTPDPPRLAHGDFDVSQIFHADGRYTGIIDLGDVLGAEWYYDLSHFLLHDLEQNPYRLLPDVLAGYRDVRSVDAEHEARMTRTAVLIGTLRLSFALARWGAAALPHPYVRWMADRVRDLVTTTT